MSNRNIGVYILFRADTAQAKAGAAEVKGAVAGVTAETQASTEATTRARGAIDQTSAARRRATEAARAQAEAERQARDAAISAVVGGAGLTGRPRAVQGALPAPLAQVPAGLAAGGAQDLLTLDTAMRAASGSSAALTAQWGRAGTAFAAAMGPVSGLTTGLRDQTAALLEEQRSLAAWGSQMDAVRARFNPLFAVSKQYELQLRDIAEAERMGAISAMEAAAARERAAQMLVGPRPGGGPGPASAGMAQSAAANLSFQINDIAMMTAMGQSPFMLMIQQGPQVAQIFSQIKASGLSLGATLAGAFRMVLTPWGLLAMGVIGGGAALVQWMTSAGEKTKTFAEELDGLDSLLGRMATNLDRVGNIRLGETFGNLTTEARELSQLMLQIDRAGEIRSISKIAEGLRTEAAKPSFWDRALAGISQGAVARSPMPSQIARPEDVRVSRYAELGAANSYEDFLTRTSTIEKMAKSGDIKGVISDLLALKAAMSGNGAVTDMSEELQKLLRDLSEASFATAEFEAAWNGTAKAEAITRQIGEMVRGDRERAEIAEATLKFGERSVEVEAIRADHIRAAVEAKLEAMGVDKASDEAVDARAAAERAIAADRELSADARMKAEQSLLDDLARQAQVSTAILKYGEDSVEVDAVRAGHARDILQQRLTEAGMLPGLVTLAGQLTEEEQKRVAAIKAANAARSADRMMAELTDQAAINAATVAYGENSLRVKELQIAAERRLFEESLKTLQVDEARKDQLRQQWELTNGLASADPFGRLAAARDRDRSHAETLDRLELELRLVGQTATARNRALAIHEAEVRMRREGYELGSREIEVEKRRAAGIADITTELERQRDAWDKVHRAAEGMIDGPIDALLKGDLKGALASFAEEFIGLYTELAWKNPMKNRMLGTNYATLDDVGGLGGIVGRLFGGVPAEPLALSGASAMSPGAMSVTTPMVHISTSGLSGIPVAAGLGPAANMPFAPAGPSMAAASLRSVAVGGATRADALTGLNGPFAAALSAMVAEAQQMFGTEAVRVTSAFRSVEQQAKLWAQALEKYGSAAEARKWVAPPGSSNHNFGLAADLKFGSPAVQQWFHQQAGRFGMGFPMGWEPWHIEPANAKGMRGQQALPVAQLERLATTAEMATGQLGTFGARAETTGQGLASLGGTFAQALQMFGASKGPGGMIAATLLGGIFKGIGIPGFERGGWTGTGAASEVAGLVHAEEYVFDAAATRRIGVSNLEAIRRGAMRGYQTGGYVTGGRPAVPAGQRAGMAGPFAPAMEERRHVFEMNVSGTGNAEIAAAVRAAISQAFDEYDRNVFAGRVRMIVNDDWAA